MALPKLDSPIFNVTVPVIDVELTLRPYLMKEEKILLLAQQSDDPEQVTLAMKQVINNCIVKGDLDIDNAPNFVVEFLLLQLRKQSVGSTVKVSYRDTEDDQLYDFEIDLNEVSLSVDPEHTDSIEITDNLGLLMKYPTLNTLAPVQAADNDAEMTYEILKTSIDKVFTDDEVIDFDGHSSEEKNEFLDQFDRKQMEKILQFFETMPTLKHTLTYTNQNGNERKIELSGVSDFFT